MSLSKGPGKVFSEDELIQMAKTELNEDPKRTAADLKHIKEWIKKQPHLAKTARTGNHNYKNYHHNHYHHNHYYHSHIILFLI